MRGDFSRVTFRPQNHFTGVLLQQGRVQLDAEFNEQVAIGAHRDRETTRDVVGPSGAPLDGGGFEISVASMLRGVAAGEHAWAVGEDGTILRSEGGTERWAIEADAANGARLNAVDLDSEDTGWAVGDGATILRLAGTTWQPEPAGSDVGADLHGVHAGATEAWAVGAAGTVLAWDGSKWEPRAQDAGVVRTLRDVHFAGTVGVAVGDGGTILLTRDGKDWAVQPSPLGTGDLYGVFLADAEHGWAVGEQGTVLFFDGEEWSEQTLSPRVTATLRAVAMVSTTEGVAVGDGGTALRLQDGSWTEAPTWVDADLRAVAALDGGAVVGVGDDVALTLTPEGWTAAPDMPADENGPRGRTLTLSAGDIYVEGVRYENERPTSLPHQPEPPLGPMPGGDGEFGVVLQVQEQFLTATEREHLREEALGGPDSATRTRAVWQASLVDFTDEATSGHSCADVAALIPADGPRGRLRARAKPAAIASSECVVPPNGGYRRLQNQLYRLEIHAGTEDTGGAATYVWSRDNGSVIARPEHVSADAATKTGEVRLSGSARDAVGFGPDQYVEITDAGRLLRGERGVLGQIGVPQGSTLPLVDLEQAPLSMADFPVDPIVRRWDGTGIVKYGEWLELEDGVFVEFAGGEDADDAFRTGDYWTIPARTLSGRVEWPQSGGIPRFEDRHGPRRQRTPLAVATRNEGVWHSVRDCRKLFPPLTELVHMYYAGGDAQEATPPMPRKQGNLIELDELLAVGVVNGGTPIAGATVEFTVDEKIGAGRVGKVGKTAQVTTNESGIARCAWEVDGLSPDQAVGARLVDPLEQAPPQVIRFTARLSLAEEVAYDPGECTALAGRDTVQKAIDRITRLAHISALSGSGEDVMPKDEEIAVAVVVTTGCGAVEGATVSFKRGPRGSGAIAPAEVKTDTKGIATCKWTPDTTTPTQDLVATLADVPKGTILHKPDEVRFVANVNLASDTGYVPPANCPELKGAGTVKDALDRLVGLLPRLFHVSGSGAEAPAGGTLALRAGIANRCSIKAPRVRFERTIGDGAWEVLADVAPGDDAIATHRYTVGEDERQLVRAWLLTDAAEPTGHPVYFDFNVSPKQSGSALLNFSVLNVNCASGPGFGQDFSKVMDIGGFTKVAPGSLLELVFEGRLFVEAFDAAATGAVFELRVDDRATQSGRARATLKKAEAGGDGVQAGITGIFEGLGAGAHMVSMWVRAAHGTGQRPILDPGCWSSDRVIVKELQWR